MNTNDPTARIAEMQTRGLESAAAFGRVATGMFERLARQNYAVMGDVVDYTLAQIRIPTQHADPRAALEAQAAGTRSLAEKARVRADEYATIAGEMRELMGSAVKVGAAKASAPAATPAAPKPVAPTTAAPKAVVPAPAKRAAKPAPDAGGTPIVLPGDSPKAAARKTAAATAKAPTAKRAAAKRTVEKQAAKKAATKGAAKATRATPAAKKPARPAKG